MSNRTFAAIILLFLLTTFGATASSAMSVSMNEGGQIDVETAWQSSWILSSQANNDGSPLRLLVKHAALKNPEKSRSGSGGVLKGENLLLSVPKGYKIDFQNRQGRVLTTEMVPQGETVNAWTEMVTMQVFLGGVPHRTPAEFFSVMDAAWKQTCRGAKSQFITKGTENGYPFALWLESCPANPSSGKPETTLFKAIQGNDSFYVVQKAWKYTPASEEVATWSRFLRNVTICDSRIAGKDCPNVH